MNSLNKDTNKNIPEMAIVVVSYDGYSDLWDDFFTLLNKYWEDRPYCTYLANNIKKPSYKGVDILNCGEKAQWSTRTRIAVEKLKQPFICLLVEDYFIGSKIDNSVISDALNFIKQEDINYYKLNNFSRVNTEFYKNIKFLVTIPENMEYGVSLQPAIWKREHLLELLGEGGYSAWKFELDQVEKTYNESNKPLKGCVLDKRNILNICHGVVQGKYLPSAIRYFEKQNYNLDTTNRKVMTNREYAIYKLKGFGREVFKRGTRKVIKNIFRKIGVGFVSDKI